MISQNVIDRCIKQQRDAQKSLYEACAPYIFGIVKNYVRNHEYRKDAMQEIFAQLFMSLKNYNPSKGDFKAWISKIAVYKCIDVIKKQNRFKPNFSLEILADFSDDSFQQLNNLTKTDIENLLSKMPDGYRTIFLLSVIDNYEHKEIGELLNISAETSRSQLSRAKSWIRRNLFSNSKSLFYEAL